MGRFSPTEVNERLEVLKLIESYLDFIGKPGQYHLIEQERNMEKFNSLRANVIAPLRKQGDVNPAEIAKLSALAFVLINRTDLSHWDIRLLSKIAADTNARSELYRNYDAKKKVAEQSPSKLEENY